MTTKELIIKAKSGDIEARNKIVMENQKLVYKIANRYRKVMDFEVGVQEGSIGLIKAIEGFDLERDNTFGTYATYKILGEIQRYLRDFREDRPYRVRREDFVKLKKILKAKEELAQEFRDEPNNIELAIYLDMDIKEVGRLLEMENYRSIYEVVWHSSSEDILIIDSLENRNCISEEQIIDKIAIQEAIAQLNERERTVIELTYFKEMGQCEISRLLNIPQPTVCRNLQRALEKIKTYISEEKEENPVKNFHRLTNRQKQVYKLIKIEKRSVDETADILGVQVQTVNKSLSDIKKRLEGC